MLEIQCGPKAKGVATHVAADVLQQYGPTLAVQIGMDVQYRPDTGGVPALPATPHAALVDTGASLSCIDSELAVSLSLPIVNRRAVSGVHGSNEVNVHLAQIYVPALRCTIYGEFAGVHLKAGGQPHSALLGRGFLKDFTMTYDGRIGSVIIRRS